MFVEFTMVVQNRGFRGTFCDTKQNLLRSDSVTEVVHAGITDLGRIIPRTPNERNLGGVCSKGGDLRSAGSPTHAFHTNPVGR